MNYQPEQARIEYLYWDEHLLIVNKPAGLLTVPGRGPEKQDCLIHRIQTDRYPEALIVHRLDMETSGLVLIARGKVAERALSILFQQRQVYKAYRAVVAGDLQHTYGTIALPLLADWPNRPRQKVNWQQGKAAETHYQVLERVYERGYTTTRLRLIPITGRSHQLRVHLMSIGHPILGDSLYADESAKHLSNRLLLHASRLDFQHPFTRKKLDMRLPAPF